MSSMPWNSFQETHQKTIVFMAIVSKTTPKQEVDRNGKKLPTPYNLFKEWAKANLIGTYSSTTLKGCFAFGVTDDSDANAINSRFGVSGGATKTPLSDQTYTSRYCDHDYGKLAVELGYKINGR